MVEFVEKGGIYLFKKILFLSVFIFSILGLNTTYANAKAAKSTEVNVQYFDANDNPIDPNQLQLTSAMSPDTFAAMSPDTFAATSAATSIETITAAGYSYYDFGNTIFSSYVWIKSGSTFYNPHWIEFELTNRPEMMSVRAYKSDGTYQGKVDFSGAGLSGWQSAPFDWLPRSTSYKFKLVNDGSGEVRIRSGSVVYN